MNTFIARQGDVGIARITKLPDEKLKEVKTGVILLGESTGHSHRLVDGSVFMNDKGDMYLTVKNKGKIVHEEHKTIDLDKGYYAVIRQREYVSSDMVRAVVD